MQTHVTERMPWHGSPQPRVLLPLAGASRASLACLKVLTKEALVVVGLMKGSEACIVFAPRGMFAQSTIGSVAEDNVREMLECPCALVLVLIPAGDRGSYERRLALGVLLTMLVRHKVLQSKRTVVALGPHHHLIRGPVGAERVLADGAPGDCQAGLG
jgi:hypothetical protein